MKTIIITLFLSTILWAAEPDEIDFSRFILLNGGTGEIESKPKKEQSETSHSDFHLELGFERLTQSEKEEAKKIALEFWIHSPGLLAEETLVPDFSFQLDEEIEGLGDIESKIWQVRVEHMAKGINALIWINAETKETRAWGIERELKEGQNRVAEGI